MSNADLIAMDVPVAPGGVAQLNNALYGNLVTLGQPGTTTPRVTFPTPAGLLQQFSFWLADPGAEAGDLSFKTGILRITDTDDYVSPDDIIFESAWRTLESGGGTHRVDTNVEIMMPAGGTYLFYILTPGYSGPSWQVLLDRNAEIESSYSQPRHMFGAWGQKAGGGYDDWIGVNAWDRPGARLRDDLPHEGDLAMRATFAVPEPSSLLLMLLGGGALLRRRRVR